MKHNHVYQVCVISLISLSVFGNTPTDRLIGISFNPNDNHTIVTKSIPSESEFLCISQSQLNGNLMAKNSEDNKSLYSIKSISVNNIPISTNEAGNISKEEQLNSTSRNSLTTASGFWESPSRTSLMRLHEFLLTEQLMQD